MKFWVFLYWHAITYTNSGSGNSTRMPYPISSSWCIRVKAIKLDLVIVVNTTDSNLILIGQLQRTGHFL